MQAQHTSKQTPFARNDAAASSSRLLLRVSVTAATALVVLAGCNAAQTDGSHDAKRAAVVPVRNTATAPLLERSADLTAHTAAPSAGQYRYVTRIDHNVDLNPDTTATQSTLSQETWIPADLHANWTERRRELSPASWVPGHGDGPIAAERSVPAAMLGEWTAPCGEFDYAQGTRTACDPDGDWRRPTPEFLSSLPADPAALYLNLRNYALAGGDHSTEDPTTDAPAYLVQLAGQVLSNGWVSPEFRGNLYRALAMAPNLKLVEHVKAGDGKDVTGLAVEESGRQSQLLVDPSTGEFRGFREFFTDDRFGFPAGTEVSTSTVSVTLVDRPGGTPAAQ